MSVICTSMCCGCCRSRGRTGLQAAHGQEALERQFEEAGLEYWEVGRKSVI